MLDQLPPWLVRAGWTVLTVGTAYGLGFLIRSVVAARLVRLAERTSGAWDDILAGELTRRVPFWSLLVGFWLSLGHWALGPDAHLFATRVLASLATASVTLAAARMATRMLAAYGASTTPPIKVSGLTLNIVRIVITTLGVLVIIRGLGRDITPMLTAVGVGGLAVALAVQEPLSNLFAGLFVSIAGQLRIGDYVRLEGGTEGTIADFNWRETRLQTLGGHLIVVPNAKLAQAIVSNFTLPQKEFGFSVEMGVTYTSDLERVEQLAVEVARSVIADVPGAVPGYEPSVRFSAFGETAIRLGVNMRGQQLSDQYLLRHELIKRLHTRFRAEGLVIAPVHSVRVMDPEQPA